MHSYTECGVFQSRSRNDDCKFDKVNSRSLAVWQAASASVIVTDRLHASILSLLMTKPHVYLDQSYGKVTSTRSVALSSSVSCLKLEGTLFTSASSLRDATEKAISFACGEKSM